MNFDKNYWNKLLKKKEFFSTSDLLKMGLFGSKNGWYLAIEEYKIPVFYITDHRMIVYRDDLIKFLEIRACENNES
jgi:hypothetical protein